MPPKNNFRSHLTESVTVEMGTPVAVCLSPGYEEAMDDHPLHRPRVKTAGFEAKVAGCACLGWSMYAAEEDQEGRHTQESVCLTTAA